VFDEIEEQLMLISKIKYADIVEKTTHNDFVLLIKINLKLTFSQKTLNDFDSFNSYLAFFILLCIFLKEIENIFEISI
jgi:hypothetical protein